MNRMGGVVVNYAGRFLRSVRQSSRGRARLIGGFDDKKKRKGEKEKESETIERERKKKEKGKTIFKWRVG